MQKIKKHLGLIVFVGAFLGGMFTLAQVWLPGDVIIGGHDSGLALDSSTFLQKRFFAWDDSLNFGIDNSMFFGSLTIHGIDYLLAFLGQTRAAGNSFSVFFWLSTIFLSAVFLALNLRPKLGKYFVYFFPVFITFNFYIFQAVFIIERAKFGLLGSMMVFLAFWFRLEQKKQTVFQTAFLSALFITIFNGGSLLGLPLYGGLAAIVGSLFLYYLFSALPKFNFSRFKLILSYFLVFSFFYFLLNAYSIYPYISRFFTEDYQVLVSSETAGAQKGWLEFMSRGSSFLNLIRLQGVPDWYDKEGIGANPSHAYSKLYIENLGYLSLSLIVPLLLLLSVWFSKRDKKSSETVVVFGVIFLISLFLSAGLHPPLGFLYEFLFDNLPGFAIFRSPYYKFGSAFYLSSAVLIAYALGQLAERVSKKYLTVFLIFLGYVWWGAYHYPIFLPEYALNWNKDMSTRLSVPDYVYQFSDWASREQVEGRFLLYPPLDADWQSDAYDWGYWSLSTLLSVSSDAQVITNDSSLNTEEASWVNKLYDAMAKGDQSGFEVLSQKLGVSKILLRRDVSTESLDGETNTLVSGALVLDKIKGLETEKEFGPWVVYGIPGQIKLFNTESELIAIPQDKAYLAREYKQTDSKLFLRDTERVGDAFIDKEIDAYYCQSCFLEYKPALTSLAGIRILPNSPLYFIKARREKKYLESLSSKNQKTDAYLGYILRRASEIKIMIDQEADEAVIIRSIKTLNQYFEEFYSSLEIEESSYPDFQQIKNRLDIAKLIGSEFKRLAVRKSYWDYGAELSELVEAVIVNSERLLNFYDLYQNVDQYQSRKVYRLSFKEGETNLFIDRLTLPQTNGDLTVLPAKLEYISQDERYVVEEPQNTDGRWIGYLLPDQVKSPAILEVHLPETKSILGNLETVKKQTLNGESTCLTGRVSNFTDASKYAATFVPSSSSQQLRLYFVENMDSKTELFLHGEDEIDITPLHQGQKYHYVYNANYNRQSLDVFICREDGGDPELESFEVKKVISPLVVLETELPDSQLQEPEIDYQKINQTKYRVEIKNATNPFVLSFNQRFSSYWKISLDSKEPLEAEHFILNGYANAWKLDKMGNYSLKLEYSPQRKLYLGGLISLASLVFGFSYYFYTWRKDKHDRKN